MIVWLVSYSPRRLWGQEYVISSNMYNEDGPLSKKTVISRLGLDPAGSSCLLESPRRRHRPLRGLLVENIKQGLDVIHVIVKA